ncbi:Flavonoid 3',5'-hydroxylase 2 [Camellia lanceoleosa]|uniref:Flavonoid 3',5'-hydroxylase 2 n=1 Tax=Camellia lanceoleosa TaxID=1840588 RepID=A0ACC0F3M7_9ERIC|nr:Flavonoid 3',5'-hydroxylase 2 [Camellia lanceoleosa]
MVVELMTTAGYFNIGLQGIERGMKGLHKKFDVLITKMIEEHMASAYQRKGKPDFLAVVMAQQENSGEERLSINNIKALLLVFLSSYSYSLD